MNKVIQNIRKGLAATVASVALGVTIAAAPSASAATTRPSDSHSATSAVSTTTNCTALLGAVVTFAADAAALSNDVQQHANSTVEDIQAEALLGSGLALASLAKQLPSCITPPIKSTVTAAIATATAALGTIYTIYTILRPLIQWIADNVIEPLIPLF